MSPTTAAVLTLSVLLAQPGDKPRTRSDAENRQTNLSRYVLGGFGANATASLGIMVIYSDTAPQGIVISQFKTDSPARNAGLMEDDWILEVDGSAVGQIRQRYYEPWKKYGRSGPERTEVLVSYNTVSGRMYYYPKVRTQIVAGTPYCVSPDVFTVPKPTERVLAETRDVNMQRYRFGAGNFERYSPYELGADVQYSYDSGAAIVSLKAGGAAARAGLRVGDCILEVQGAPVGVFGDRTYEVWQQYKYSCTNVVEFLVCFHDANGALRYYYPQVTLDNRQTPN